MKINKSTEEEGFVLINNFTSKSYLIMCEKSTDQSLNNNNNKI